MIGRARQRNVSNPNQAQAAISQLPSPSIQTPKDQTPQTLSAALAIIRQLTAANDTLRQNYTHLQAAHAILRIKYKMMEEDHERAIVNEDTVEEENDILREENGILRGKNEILQGENEIHRGERDILREVLREMQGKYEAVKADRDYAIDKQYLAEEEGLIFLAGLQVCREDIEMLQVQLRIAGVQWGPGALIDVDR